MEEYLLTDIDIPIDNKPISNLEFFTEFLNKLEGWKTKCKNLHWSAPKRNIHIYLDEFLDILNDYQDGLAEGIMGILGKLQPNVIKSIESNTLNAIDFINEIQQLTLEFYNKIPQDAIYKGVISECETFIQNINKYKYLFGLCDIKNEPVSL